MAPTLLVLAAGMGSRYGGLKQIDPVGPSGETVLDYAVFDAIRAGFGRVVFVIRREFEEAFRSAVTSKYAGRIAVGLVYQSWPTLPAGCAVAAGPGKALGHGPRGVVRPRRGGRAVRGHQRGRLLRGGSFARSRPSSGGGGRTVRDGGIPPRQHALRERDRVPRRLPGARGPLVSITEETAIARADVGPGRRFSGTRSSR
jgi:hypothetical protein